MSWRRFCALLLLSALATGCTWFVWELSTPFGSSNLRVFDARTETRSTRPAATRP